MNINENIKSDADDSECKLCFQKTKKEIKGFFEYIDCDQNEYISAENLYNGMKNMKLINTHAKTTTTMVNSFFINAMEEKSAGMDLIDF